MIVDMMVPYEVDEKNFEKAREEKRIKYQPIADWLMANGHTHVQTDALIVRSLGSRGPRKLKPTS